MPYDKGDFTEQGINGAVTALVRLNDKRVVKMALSSDDESDNCDISGKVYDLLNGTSYDIGSGGGGDYPVYGPNTALVGSFTKSVNLNNDTTYSSWTPSNTASNITTAESGSLIVNIDPANYNYFVKVYQYTSIKIKENTTLNKIAAVWAMGNLFFIFSKPNTPADWSSGNCNALRTESFNIRELGYYSNGSLQSVTNGYYGPMFIDTPSPSATTYDGHQVIRVDLPAIKARCNDNYFVTTQAGNIDDADFHITYEVYQTPKEDYMVSDLLSDMIENFPLRV